MTYYLFVVLFGAASLFHAPEVQPVQDSTEVKMEIHGLYELRNLFISNPLLENGKRCITRAPELNGIPTAKVADANTLEIKLNDYELALGDVVKITIWHSPDCKPVVINPEVLDPSD